MKRIIIYAAICSLVAMFCCDCKNENKATGIGSGLNKVKIPYKEYMIGADISWVQAAEDRGVRYSDNGVQKDILEILKDHGFNYIRLRVLANWHDKRLNSIALNPTQNANKTQDPK